MMTPLKMLQLISGISCQVYRLGNLTDIPVQLFFHPLSQGLASAEWLATIFFSLSFLPSSVSMANLSSSVATISSPDLFFFFRPSPKRSGSCLQSQFSLQLIFITPLQSFENSQALILLVFRSFSRLILSLSFLCSSVYEALFALSFSFLSERFSLCLIHSQKKQLSESFLSKRILELKCCLGSGIFTTAVKRGVAPHTRKQRVLAAISKLRSAFLTIRVIRTKFSGITFREIRADIPRTYYCKNMRYRIINWRASVASETLSGLFNRIVYILLLEKWFPLWGERAHSLKLFCMYDKRFEISKTKQNGGGNRTTDLTIYLHHVILAFIIECNQIIFVYIHKYIHALYIMNCSKK